MSIDGPPSDPPWSPEAIQGLLTADRLRSYLLSCDQDLSLALDLYRWNLEASAAVMQTTAMVEVIVRNALDSELVTWAHSRSAAWPGIVPLDPRGRADIAKAIERATNFGRSPRTHGKVVAELNFGFWRYLTAQRYHASLWVPVLHSAFPGGDPDIRTRRRQVEKHLANLMLVRNRAAHHEPIHRRNLLADLGAATEVVAWIHPDAGFWLSESSMLPATVAAKPVTAS